MIILQVFEKESLEWGIYELNFAFWETWMSWFNSKFGPLSLWRDILKTKLQQIDFKESANQCRFYRRDEFLAKKNSAYQSIAVRDANGLTKKEYIQPMRESNWKAHQILRLKMLLRHHNATESASNSLDA